MQTELVKYFAHKLELDTLSITEIETLIAKYPYSSVYRMLLAKKMPAAGSRNVMLYSNDRLMLHDMSAQRAPEEKTEIPASLPHSDARLTLGDTVSINDDAVHPERVEVSEQTEPETASDQTVNPEPVAESHRDTASDMEMADNNSEAALPAGEEESKAGEELTVDGEVVKTGNDNKEKHNKSHKKKGKKKKGKFLLKEFRGLSEYSLWLLSLREPGLDKKIKKEEKEAKKKELKKNVMKSVTKKSSLVSEPLADLLAAQGHLDDAKKMYEQLMQKFPEKSSYFAAKINDLINKS